MMYCSNVYEIGKQEVLSVYVSIVDFLYMVLHLILYCCSSDIKNRCISLWGLE